MHLESTTALKKKQGTHYLYKYQRLHPKRYEDSANEGRTNEKKVQNSLVKSSSLKFGYLGPLVLVSHVGILSIVPDSPRH